VEKNVFNRIYGKLSRYQSRIILGSIVVFLAYVAYEYYVRYFDILSDPKRIKNIIISYGRYSIAAFLVLQIIQVIAFFIPGEIVQIAGGYIYGTFFGSILSILGITLGSIIAYGISNYLGKPFINKIISKKNMGFFDKLLNLGSINYIVFLLYLIPGIPKDVLAYICGISTINFKEFIMYSTLGRFPGIFISVYFGSKIYSENISVLVIISIITTILFSIGVIKGEKIIKYMIKHLQKNN
jgi:uncharacterized membrane protein YdjX (TVP38/TMEM64 family)